MHSDGSEGFQYELGNRVFVQRTVHVDEMKLLFCPHCQDVLKLRFEQRTCECGQSWGHYEDQEHARLGGAAIPLGIGNRSLVDALESRPADGQGTPFLAFVIPVQCPSITDDGHGSTLKFRGTKTKRVEIMEALLEERR